jgi:hypothetical protein
MEESKFTPMLRNARKVPVAEAVNEEPQVQEPEESQVTVPVVLASQTEQRGRGRPRAKSSDPEYQPTTVILRKVTKRRAAHLLEDREMGKDLSELIEELLTEWLARQA